MLNSLTLDNNQKVTNSILTGVSPDKIKPFDTNFETSNLKNARVILKFNNSVSVQKIKNSPLCSISILNLYIGYELNNQPRNPSNNLTLKNCLFGTVKLVRNADKSKFTYNDRGIAFDGEVMWSFANDFGRNVVIFGVDNTSSSHTDNQKNNFLVLGEGPTDGINDTTGAAEKRFSINFSKAKAKFC